MWCCTRIKQVHTCICRHGPVVVFTGTVDACKWFFMEQAYKIVAKSHFLHCFHNKLVMIGCNVCCIVDRSKLMLCRCNFIVLCFCCYTQLPEFFIDIIHVCGYTFFNASEIVVIQFLSFRSRCAEECTSCKDQVFSLIVCIFVNEEIFLFRTDTCCYSLCFCIAKCTDKTKCLNI